MHFAFLAIRERGSERARVPERKRERETRNSIHSELVPQRVEFNALFASCYECSSLVITSVSRHAFVQCEFELVAAGRVKVVAFEST